MTTETTAMNSLIAAATVLAAAGATAHAAGVDELVAAIKSTDDKVRGPAWQGAGPAGAPAIKPLAAVMTDPDFEIARCAKRALWKIVRHAGRPGAEKEARAVQAELVPLLAQGDVAVRREALWMLSEIADDKAVPAMAALLNDPKLREDARCALVRIPGRAATKALSSALDAAPADFKPALADGLRARGEKVAAPPSQKLVPTRQTTVRPIKET
jgi:hypothetical protein